jgi:hypothetical protein
MVGEQVFRQVLSAGIHASGVLQPVPHACSFTIWHTAIPSTCMHLSPVAQSTDFMHALWHEPNLHSSPSAQSLFRVQLPPSSSFFLPLLHPTRARAHNTDRTTWVRFIFFLSILNYVACPNRRRWRLPSCGTSSFWRLKIRDGFGEEGFINPGFSRTGHINGELAVLVVVEQFAIRPYPALAAKAIRAGHGDTVTK